MKKLWNPGLFALCVVLLCGILGQRVQAAEAETVKTGVMAGGMDLSGKTMEEVQSAVAQYVAGLEGTSITLVVAGGKEVTVTAGDLGITWGNTDLPKDAIALGRTGNVIERYKVIKDMEKEPYVLPIELDFDVDAINSVLESKCVKYNHAPINVSLTRNADGTFQVVDGTPGIELDVELSIDTIYEYLTGEWDHNPCRIELNVAVSNPKGSAEELSAIESVLGTYTTSYSTSGASRSKNVETGVSLINGTVLYPGETFSTYELVAPFTEANGYMMADSYSNGKVVKSLGGGICQVSTTLYNAVLLAELEVTERHNHSMIVSYVSPSADAAIAESAGKDFQFVNNYDYPIYIEGITANKKITFNIYGKDDRPTDRTVQYESEILEVIHPTSDTIYADPSQPIGYIVSTGAHIGYKARLWKVVKENGVQVSREQVNSSNYRVSPRTATVGTATSNPSAYNEIMAAIGTGNIDHVKNVIRLLTAPPAPSDDD